MRLDARMHRLIDKEADPPVIGAHSNPLGYLLCRMIPPAGSGIFQILADQPGRLGCSVGYTPRKTSSKCDLTCSLQRHARALRASRFFTKITPRRVCRIPSAFRT